MGLNDPRENEKDENAYAAYKCQSDAHTAQYGACTACLDTAAYGQLFASQQTDNACDQGHKAHDKTACHQKDPQQATAAWQDLGDPEVARSEP